MIRDDKLHNAFYSLHSLLVIARSAAYKGDSKTVVNLLDVAEYLPRLIAIQEDRTEEYRAQLETLARKNSFVTLALERFDQKTVPEKW